MSDTVSTELSLEEVSNLINDQDCVIVDTRPTDAYNGWKLDGVRRGGHLPGAVDFPASWLDSEHEAKAQVLSAALRAKGIEPDRKILLYGTNKRDRDRVATYLRDAGVQKLFDFDFELWANDPGKPLERYENFHLLC